MTKAKSKIFILPVESKFQPGAIGIKFPPHNTDYGVEQDFHSFLLKHPEYTTTVFDEAGWFYLPIYWTRWHIQHDYGKHGLNELAEEVSKHESLFHKVFTICQYSDGPLVNLGSAAIFLSSRRSQEGIDIPLICEPHPKPLWGPRKRFFASFSGSPTHPMRDELEKRLSGQPDVFMRNKTGFERSELFAQGILESDIALSPRGHGGGSFRFFEAMQLGTVPFLIGDIDVRPFKPFIKWDEISFYAPTVEEAAKQLDQLRKQKARLRSMGRKARRCWKERLCYQKWCHLVFKELQRLEKESAVLIS